MGRLGRFVLLFVLVVFSATRAGAQSRADLETCARQGPDDARLQACARVITSGKLSALQLANAYDARGRIYYLRKQFDAAIQELTEAIRHQPTVAVFYDSRGLSFRGKNEFDRAIADFNEALRLDPQRASTFRNRALTFEQKGEFDKAIGDFRRSQQLNPNDPIAVKDLKRLEQRQAKMDCSSPGTDDEKLQRCERLIASGTVKGLELARAYNARGVVFNKRRQFDAAIAELTEALRHETTDPGMYQNRGAALFGRRDYDQAIVDFNEALRLDPKQAQAYNWRANAFYIKRNYDAVIADAAQALALYANAPNYGIYNIRGLAYLWKGEHGRAIADFTEAIKLKSDDANLFSNRGFALFRKGEHDLAIADFNEVIRLNPAGSSLARSRLGTILSLRGEHDRALAELNEAVRLTPRRALPYWYRGFAFERAGKMDEALADFHKVLSIDLSSEDMGQVVARIELRAAEEAAQAIARIEQQIAAKAAAGAAPPAASAAPRNTIAAKTPAQPAPEQAARLFQETIMQACTSIPLGEHVVSGTALPRLVQAVRDLGIAKVEAVRKNADGATVYNVTLNDGIDRRNLKIMGDRACVPRARQVEVKAVKNVSQSKGGVTGWDALVIDAEFVAEPTELWKRLRATLVAGEQPTGPQKARVLYRHAAATNSWVATASDLAAIDREYQTNNIWRALATD